MTAVTGSRDSFSRSASWVCDSRACVFASDPIYDFSWLQSKTGTEAMTVSTDGTVFWWDTRRLGQPLEELTLREKAATAGAQWSRHEEREFLKPCVRFWSARAW